MVSISISKISIVPTSSVMLQHVLEKGSQELSVISLVIGVWGDRILKNGITEFGH